MSSIHLAHVIDLADEAATLALGARLASHVLALCQQTSLIIALSGSLGSGKTTLVRGLLRALGVSGAVKSPSYSLLERYEIHGINIFHCDFYRLNVSDEYLEAGLDECFAGPGLRLVEWAERAAPYLPAADMLIVLQHTENSRQAGCSAQTPAGQQCLDHLIHNA